MAEAKKSPGKSTKSFKRFNRVGILPDVAPVYARDPRDKSKSVIQVHQELLVHQRREIDDICTGLQLRLEHVKKALPVPKKMRPSNEDCDESVDVKTPLESRIDEEIAAEQDESDEPLTPLDRMAIALEACQDAFPAIGKQLDDEAGAHVNVELTSVLLDLVETIETCVHDKVVRDRVTKQTLHEVRSPEKVTKKPMTMSPRVQLQSFKRQVQDAASTTHQLQSPRPNNHPLTKPFELESLLTKDNIPVREKTPRKDNTFREVRKNRQFPPTKVPKEEFIEKEYSYCPVEARFDMQSVHIHVDEAKMVKDTWVVVEFPKARPKLTSDQVAFLSQWQSLRFRKVQETTAADSDALLRMYLHYTDTVMYEMCRLLYDKCPTSANLLYGLWHFFFNIVAFINKSIEEELTVLKQTVRGLKIEVEVYQTKIAKHAGVIHAMREKLTQKTKTITLEREKCIRQRNDLNKYLSADQTLVRLAMSLIQSIYDIFPDKTPAPTSSRHFTCLEALDEMTRTLQLKFSVTAGVDEGGGHAATARLHRLSQSSAAPPPLTVDPSHSNILTNFDVESIAPELDATQKRLAQLLTLSSPDCTLGWDAQAVWQHAFFIPPVDEVVEMEARVRHMVLRLERAVAARGTIRRRVHRATQTPSDDDDDLLHATSSSPKHSLRAVKVAAAFVRRSVVALPVAATPKRFELKRVGEMKTLVPAPLQRNVHRLSAAYESRDYTVGTTSRVITWLANSLIGQLAGAVNVHSDVPRAHMPRDMLGLSPTDAIYRLFLARFRVPLFANERLLDLVTSLSHLDTQSDKIHLWCRLLHLAGVDPLPPAAFWFVVHVLHVLAKCSHDGYYVCELPDEAEYVGQQAASDGLAIVFASFPAEIVVRCKTKLVGLAQIYGAMWIPVYAVVAMCVDEWEARFFAVTLEIETHFANALKVDSLVAFDQVVRRFLAAAPGYVVATAYAAAVQKAACARLVPLDCAAACLDEGLVPPSAAAQLDKTTLLFGVPSDTMLAKTTELSLALLRAVWATTKASLTRAIEQHTDNAVAGLRLIAPLDHALQEEAPAAALAWHLMEQLIALAYSSRGSTMTVTTSE
ncbi:Aste57867_5588 [Aphanomyces stellatus]|uniref:Aste57867_5588 protein n=1 Tax=Aphanomyces stellatus TaxID=120398 RepID=A0A485KEQ1_9STRA|nr:hypothetical protein As57867_005575 [Aphanomyces stellatus]VFT82634.1 Aste57867_5588 [Aphanomyces stellatus]